MGVVVFDSDVLIGFLNRDDAHHENAVEQVRASLAPGTRRLLTAVNYAEILIGPLRVGAEGHVKRMLEQLDVEIMAVDTRLAERAAAVRARTALKSPDVFALAAAAGAAARHGWSEVSLASFDGAVLKADTELRAADR